MDKNSTVTIQKASEMLDCKPTQLRSFLRRGLVPHIRNDARGYRVLNARQIDLLAILLGMKQAGFSGQQIRQYSRLCREGKKTKSERLAMLTTRKHQLRQEIEACEKAIDFIERQEEIDQQGSQNQKATH